ncbi:MAG: DUF309 domain-containing protein [Gemmataceae bacterium]|nr:DUF309 domain-containing protein [Gemmataceae bacterium]MCI0738920.1 DUF309 domain-containing protein [Gemmataceae bacterium]
MSSPTPRRLLPDEPLPPYGYVPGRLPHPVSDPAGHSYGVKLEPVSFDADRWRHCHAYLRGIDLYNHGYYWEAHEAWEQLWHAAGKTGVYADFFKGLIHLAAAGVKMREGIDAGVRSHTRRAANLLRGVRSKAGEWLLGLRLEDLILFAEEEKQAPKMRSGVFPAVDVVFSLSLIPNDDEPSS